MSTQMAKKILKDALYEAMIQTPLEQLKKSEWFASNKFKEED